MRSLPAAALAVMMLAVLSSLPAAARTEPVSPILYEMGKDSSWEQGCFAPCLRPIMFIEPIRGLADSAQPAARSGFWYLARSVAGLTGENYDSGNAAEAGSRDPGLRQGACP